MSLIEAMVGLPPVTLDDGRWSRERALDTVRSLHGRSPTGLVATIVDLLSDDEEVGQNAFRQLSERSDDHRADTALPTRTPTAAAATGSAVDELTAHVLDDLLSSVDSLLEGSGPDLRCQDLTVYSGVAGAGLELVHHRSHPGIPDRLLRLGQLLREVVEQAQIEPGLFAGRTGIEIYLRTVDLPALERRPIPEDWRPAGHDLIDGAAGIGIGLLWLYNRDGEPHDLDVARRYARSLAGLVDPDAGLAHGLAGVLEFELRMPDPASRAEAERLADRLVAPTEAMLDRAENGTGDPLVTVSWCNGLAGLARTLRHAGSRLDRPDLDHLAVRAVEACANWTPRLRSPGQCCGAAGIGDLLLDFGHREHALQTVEHLLLRSGGTRERPTFVDRADQSSALSWSNSLTGVLGFLRRVRSGGPRILPGL